MDRFRRGWTILAKFSQTWQISQGKDYFRKFCAEIDRYFAGVGAFSQNFRREGKIHNFSLNFSQRRDHCRRIFAEMEKIVIFPEAFPQGRGTFSKNFRSRHFSGGFSQGREHFRIIFVEKDRFRHVSRDFSHGEGSCSQIEGKISLYFSSFSGHPCLPGIWLCQVLLCSNISSNQT